jgi:HAD superfamily hydrolase (TIGR01490 family)
MSSDGMDLALFDFDGTITDGDTWTPFIRSIANRRQRTIGLILFAPVMVGYALRMISGSRARPLVARFVLRGRAAADVALAGASYAEDRLPACVRETALNRIAWHKQRGDRVVVVSGGLDAYLQPWCDALGVDLICTQLEIRAGVLTGRYLHGDCTGPRKAARIRDRLTLSDYATIYGYGDSDEDAELLELAHRKFYRWREQHD